MLIDCPGCAKSYHISRPAAGSPGRNVSCPHCLTRWVATPEAPAIQPETEPPDAFKDIQVKDIQVEASSGRNRQPTYEELYGSVRRPRSEPKPQTRLKLPGAFLGFAATLGVLTGLIALRGPIVRLWPQANAAYKLAGLAVNLRGLDLQNLRASLVHEGDRALLVVEGEIANRRHETNSVPTLHLAVRDEAGQEIYGWDAAAPKTKLNVGEIVTFRARLATPPADGRDLFVQFASAEPLPQK
jgi:predicted Zn finger-like uncharacterized protein